MMITRLLLMVLALLCVAPLAHADDSPPALDTSPRFNYAYRASELAVLTGHAFDLAATQRCLGAGSCHEMNPWLARYSSPTRFTAAKFSLALVQLWTMRKLKEHGHPKIALAANFAIAGGFTALGFRNERLTR